MGTDKQGQGTLFSKFIEIPEIQIIAVCDVEIGHRTVSVCSIGNIAYELGRPLKWNHEEKFEGDQEANSMRSREMRESWKV